MYLQVYFGYNGPMMVEVLDDRDVQILRYLAGRELRGDGPPTIRDIAEVGRFKSSRAGRLRLEKLEEHGFLERGEAPSRKRRPVSLTSAGWEMAGEMPVLGRIAAGTGIDAVATDGVQSDLWRGILTGESFLLKVQGDSMNGAGIEDGDSVIVKREESPANGDIVVALLYGETVTVKRLYREGERIRLKPENAAHKDIVVAGENIIIQGRVKGLLRSLTA